MLFETLGASMLGNILTGKHVMRTGKGFVRAGRGHNSTNQLDTNL